MAATKMSLSEIAIEFAQLHSGSTVDPNLTQNVAPELRCWHNHHADARGLLAAGAAGYSTDDADLVVGIPALGSIPDPGTGDDEQDDPLIVVKGNEYAASLLENYSLVRQVMPDFRAEDMRIHVGASSFVLTYSLVGTPLGGRELRRPRCVIVTLKDGMINRVDIYEDLAATQQQGEAARSAMVDEAAILEATSRAVIRVEASGRHGSPHSPAA